MSTNRKSLDQKHKLVAAIALVCVVLLVPFAFNSFLQERPLLGIFFIHCDY